jgi:hypothetical protein
MGMRNPKVRLKLQMVCHISEWIPLFTPYLYVLCGYMGGLREDFLSTISTVPSITTAHSTNNGSGIRAVVLWFRESCSKLQSPNFTGSRHNLSPSCQNFAHRCLVCGAWVSHVRELLLWCMSSLLLREEDSLYEGGRCTREGERSNKQKSNPLIITWHGLAQRTSQENCTVEIEGIVGYVLS